jgi:hypothetical protein
MVHGTRVHEGMRTQENSEEVAAGSCPSGVADPVEPVYYAGPVELGRSFGPKPTCSHGRSGVTDVKSVAGNVIIGVGSPNMR